MAETNGDQVGSLFWGMDLDLSEFKKKAKKAEGRMKKFGSNVTAQFKTIAKGGAIIAGAFAAAGAGIMIFTKRTLEANNAQILLANSLGATQADIAALALGSERFNVKNKALIDRMREIGGIEAFSKAADEVKNAGDEVAQLDKAMELFGNQGSKILPILQQGADGIASMKAEALELGLALTPEQVEQNNVVWTIWEDTLFNIKGLSKQIGLSFSDSFGTMAAGVKGFITVFRKDIIAGADFVAEKMRNFMIGTLDLFVKFGIPFINGFILFANQIGSAFETVFNFLSPATDSALSGFSALFSGITDFIATFKQSMIIGITKPIEFAIKGAFSLLSSLSGFIGKLILENSAILNEAGLMSDEMFQGISDSFVEQGMAIRKMGRDFSKPFADAQKDAEKEMVKILTNKFKKAQSQQLKFKGIIGEFTTNFGKALENAAAVPAKIVSKALETSVSDKFAGLALSGSQEEANLLNAGKKNEQVQKDQLKRLSGIEKPINKIGAV